MLLLSPFRRCVGSTIELNAASHPVSSEVFPVTNIKRRPASGLASFVANTHHSPWNGLGTNLTLLLWGSNRKENFSPQGRNSRALKTARSQHLALAGL